MSHVSRQLKLLKKKKYITEIVKFNSEFWKKSSDCYEIVTGRNNPNETPCRKYNQSDHQNKQHCTHGNTPKSYGSYFRPKLTYSRHIRIISVHEHKPLQIIKASQQDGVNKRRHSMQPTRQSCDRLEYASLVWSHLATSTSINSFAPGKRHMALLSLSIIFLRAPFVRLICTLYRVKQRKYIHNILVNSMCTSSAPKKRI